MVRKISCICPTYNRHSYLNKSIEMFLNQTYPNKELIIIDDSPRPFKSPLLRSTQVKYFHYKTKFDSIGEKRNLCVSKSKGSIITHWDDDDYNYPFRLEYQYSFMKKNILQIITFNDVIIYDER